MPDDTGSSVGALDQAYEAWAQKPNPGRLNEVVRAAKPIISSAITSYGGGNQSLESRAKLLAAKAVRSFKPSKNTKLRNHLMVQLQPLRRIAKQRGQIVRPPERMVYDTAHLKSKEQEFFDTHGREPSDSELAEASGLSTRRLQKIRQNMRAETSESAVTDQDVREAPQLTPVVQEEGTIDRVLIEYLHGTLDPTDKLILEYKTGVYGSPVLRNFQIAKKLGITPAAVSQRSGRLAAKMEQLAGV